MTEITKLYAQTLYDLAQDEGISDLVLEQMRTLLEAFREEPDFLRLLVTPNLSKQERCAVLDESFCGMIHPYLLNFLKILTQEGIARKFSDCCRHMENCYYTDHHIIPVIAYTAQKLTNEQEQRLAEKLQAITGKTVILENRLDPACLGGVGLHYEGVQVDGTVKNRLDTVGKLLKNTVL